MAEALAELAAYFQPDFKPPGAEVIRLVAAARAAGSRWAAMAEACDIGTVNCGIGPEPGAEMMFSATQDVIRRLTGTKNYYPGPVWFCPACQQHVTDRAPTGRPVHVEHGHAQGCTRLAQDQAAEDRRRREQIPGLILDSEPAAGALQRHWLREPIIDDCPRCGWRGLFPHYLATVEDDWTRAICDDCYADLRPDITVEVKLYAVRMRRFLLSNQAVAIIRQRDRLDRHSPSPEHLLDTRQQMTWRAWWEHPTILSSAEGRDYDLEEISREEAARVAAELVTLCWPPEAARLPWVAAAYPGGA